MGYFDDIINREEPEQEQMVVEERGLAGDVGTGLLRGVANFVETTANAAEALGFENDVDDWVEDKKRTSEWLAPDVSEAMGEEGFLKRSFTGAMEALPSSVLPMAPGIAAGAAAGSFIPVVGPVVGGTIGGLLSMAGIIGLGEGRAAYETALEEGLPEEEAYTYGLKKGLLEAGTETGAAVFDIMTAGSGRLATGALRATAKTLVQKGVKDYAKDFGKIIAVENLTEQGQLELGAQIDQQYGLGEDVSWEDRLNTMGTTTMLSLMFGGVATHYNAKERKQLVSMLESDNLETQYKAGKVIYDQLKKQDGELAASWNKVIVDAKKNGLPLRIDESITAQSEFIDAWGVSDRVTKEKQKEDYDPAFEATDQKAISKATDILERNGVPIGFGLDAQMAAIPELEEGAINEITDEEVRQRDVPPSLSGQVKPDIFAEEQKLKEGREAPTPGSSSPWQPPLTREGALQRDVAQKPVATTQPIFPQEKAMLETPETPLPERVMPSPDRDIPTSKSKGEPDYLSRDKRAKQVAAKEMERFTGKAPTETQSETTQETLRKEEAQAEVTPAVEEESSLEEQMEAAKEEYRVALEMPEGNERDAAEEEALKKLGKLYKKQEKEAAKEEDLEETSTKEREEIIKKAPEGVTSDIARGKLDSPKVKEAVEKKYAQMKEEYLKEKEKLAPALKKYNKLTKVIRERVEKPKIKEPSRTQAFDAVVDEILPTIEDTELADIINYEASKYKEKLKGEKKPTKSTKNKITWTTDEDVTYGVDTAGNQYFISGEEGAYLVSRNNDSLGTFKTMSEAKAKAKGEESSNYSIKKEGDRSYAVYNKDGERISNLFRDKWRATKMVQILEINPDASIDNINKTLADRGLKTEDIDIEFYRPKKASLDKMILDDSPTGFTFKDASGKAGKVSHTHSATDKVNTTSAYVKELLAKFGIKTPNIITIDSIAYGKDRTTSSNLSEYFQGLLEKTTDKELKGLAGAVKYDPVNNEILLLYNGGKLNRQSDSVTAEVFAHETGHVLQQVLFDQLPEMKQEEIIDSYFNWVKKEVGGSKVKGDIIDALRPISVAQRMLGTNKRGMQLDVLAELSKEELGYLTSFPEWFADQSARWITTNEKPKGTVEKFFKSVVDIIRSLYVAIKGKDPIASEMKAFLKEHWEIAETMELLDMEYTPEFEYVSQSVIDDMALYASAKQNEIIGNIEADYYGVNFLTMEEAREKSLDAAKGKYTWSKEEMDEEFTRQTQKGYKVKKSLDGIGEGIREGAKKLFASGIDQLENISPAIAQKVKSYTLSISQKNAEYKKQIEPFIKAYNSLSEKRQLELSVYLYNGQRDRIKREFKGMEGIGAVDKVLKDIQGRAEAMGLDPDGKLIGNYFPRLVKDAGGLQGYLFDVDGRINIAIKEAKIEAEKKGLKWTPIMEEELINSIMQTGNYGGMLRKAGSTKKRVIDQVDPKMMEYYGSAPEALMEHIYSMNDAIAGQELIGGKVRKKLLNRYNQLRGMKKLSESQAKEMEQILDRLENPDAANSELNESLKEFAYEELSGKDADKVISIIRSRLLQKGMHGGLNTARNLGLITTLGDFTSVITQASEIVFNVYANGPKNALMGLFTKKEIDAAMVDLKAQTTEFQQGGSAKWVDKVLSATGFSKVDIFMKEAFMNSALIKARKMLRTSPEKFEAKWKPAFGKQYDQLVKELKSGKKASPMAVELAWAELMNYQPVDVIANPEAYMTGGNARIFYMLKTFQLRQANALYRESLGKALKGDNKAALKGLVALTGLIVMGGATKDELRDLWLGREVPVRDHIWDNLLNIALLSRYETGRFAQDGLGNTLISKIIPPTPWLDVPYRGLEAMLDEDKTNSEIVQLTPIVGKIVYDRWTEKGREKEIGKRKSRLTTQLKEAVLAEESIQPYKQAIFQWNRENPDNKISSSTIQRTITNARKKLREANK